MDRRQFLEEVAAVLEREPKVLCEVCGMVIGTEQADWHECPVDERTSAMMGRIWNELLGRPGPRKRAQGYRVR